MPFAGYETFDACVLDQEAQGHSPESARRICGFLEARAQGTEAGSELVRAAREAVHGIVVEVVAKSATLDRYEARMVELLQEAYRRTFGEPAAAVIDALVEEVRASRGDDGEWTDADTETLIGRLSVVANDGGLSEDEREEFGAIAEATYRYDRAKTAASLEIEVDWHLVDQQAVTWLKDHHLFWVGEHYTKELSATVADVAVSQGLQAGLGVKEIGGILKETLGGVAKRTDAYWELVGSATITRGRNFGALESVDDGGFTEIEILAVMDGRTSAICRALDGTIYRVADAVRQRDAMMAAAAPEDVKAISPWLPVADVEGLIGADATDTAALVAAGVVLPPYHGNCRTIFIVRRI